MKRKFREFRIRRKLAKIGYRLQKGECLNQNSHHHTGYRIVNMASEFVEAGEDFGLSLSDVEKFWRYGR